MFELKISLESCPDPARSRASRAIRYIASQGVGKRELLAEALLKEASSICSEFGVEQLELVVPVLDSDAEEDGTGRDMDATCELGFEGDGFSESCVDALVDFVTFLAAIPQERQDEFSDRLLEIAEEASRGIDDAVRRDELSGE